MRNRWLVFTLLMLLLIQHCYASSPIMCEHCLSQIETIGSGQSFFSLKNLSWNGCALLGGTVVIAVIGGATFYGFDRLISDGKYTRNVVRECAKLLVTKLDNMGIQIKEILLSCQQGEIERVKLIEGQKEILKMVSSCKS